MCFNAPLQEAELAGVKSVVFEKLPAGVQDDGLTLLGFYLLHTLFIDKGRLETTWTVRHFFLQLLGSARAEGLIHLQSQSDGDEVLTEGQRLW